MDENTLREARVEVLARIKQVAARHAEVVAELVDLLAQAKAIAAAEMLDGRSLFTFCLVELKLSRDQTYRYLACADVVRKHSYVLDALRAGRLTATGVATLAPYVKANGFDDGVRVLKEAEGKTVDAIERMLAELCPKPDVGLAVTPQLSGGGMRAPTYWAPAANRSRAVPLSPTSYRVTMTLSSETYRELRELRDLVSHIVPSGDLDKVIAQAIRIATKQARKSKWKTGQHAIAADTVADDASSPVPSAVFSANGDLESNRAVESTSLEDEGAFVASEEDVSADASASAPSEDERTADGQEAPGRRVNQTDRDPVPDSVRRAVYVRDGGRCAFVGRGRRRCGSTWQVEIDHIVRVADGGTSDLANLRLCCRLHNQAREIGKRRGPQSA